MGGRGRGRGRGGGGGNSARDRIGASLPGLSREEEREILESMTKELKGSGMLYPPLERFSELPGPTEFESRIVEQSTHLVRDLSDGPVDAVTGARQGAPWRLVGAERKVVGIEIESYSDRFRRPASGLPTAKGAGGSTVLDAGVLKLNPDLFPPALWAEYFDGVAADERARLTSIRERQNKRRRLLEGDDEEGKEDSDAPTEDEDDNFDFEEDDEEDHQDYDHNYFDNGEGDDDSGGEGGDDDGGRYDD